MFDADRPIITSQQDRLGRTTFAKYLARCILDHTIPDSLVIGLYGGWGAGKTSIINLTLEELQTASNNMFDDERPVILNFSPWSYSGQEQLLYNFFRRLSSEMRASPYFENAKKIIYLLELYVSFFTHTPVPKSLRLQKKFFSRETFGWESGRDLTQVKAELNTLLRNQKHKIIIIIDNIARLEDKEIKQIFQIVKSIGDYANTVYMLALDRKQVIEALNRIQGVGGTEYLEKVVQLPFDVPPISHQDLEIIVMDRLNSVLKQVPPEAWNKHYWADLYYASLKYFFENVRDITRFINTLGFSYTHVKDVVNPVDFVAISTLHVFAPEVYYGIRENKDLVTDLMDNVYELDAVKIAEDKARCDEILQRGQKISRDKILQLLIRLFPRLRRIYEPDVPFYHSEIVARKNFRICAPDIFEVYFRLSLPIGEIPVSEMNALLSLVKDEEGFALEVLRLNQDNKILKFLDYLDSGAIKNIPIPYIGHVINALMDGADLFPEGENTLVSFDTPTRVHRIFHQLLCQLKIHEERFILMREAIKKATKSLYIIVFEMMMQHEQHVADEDTFLPLEFRDFTEAHLDLLKKITVGKIVYWSEIGRLIEHPKLIPILYGWKAWGDPAECRRYVATATQETKGLLAFLCGILKEPIDQALTRYEKNNDWKKYLTHIEDFISIKTIEPRAKLLFEDDNFEKLREREQLAILIFLDLINAETVKIIPKTTV